MYKLSDTQWEAKHHGTSDELTREKKRQRIWKDGDSSEAGTTHDMQLETALTKTTVEEALANHIKANIIDPSPVLVMTQQHQHTTTAPGLSQILQKDSSTGLISPPSSIGGGDAPSAPSSFQEKTTTPSTECAASSHQPIATAQIPFLQSAPSPPYHPFMIPTAGLLLNQVVTQINPSMTAATIIEHQQQQVPAPQTTAAIGASNMMIYPSFPFHMVQTESGSAQYPAVVPPNSINATAAHLMAMAAAAGISSHQQQNVMNMLMVSPPQQLPIPGTTALPSAGGVTTVSQQPQTLASFVGLSGPPQRGPLLYMPTDDDVLSENQTLLRQQVEFFEAALNDVGKTTSGRRRPIMLSQVGIQCRHCGAVPARYRQKGAIYYPAKLAGIYQAAQNMAVTHLTTLCQHIDEHTKEQLKAYQEGRSVTGHGGKQYWAGTARAQGVVESEEGGLRFVATTPLVPSMTPVFQTQHPRYTSMAPWQSPPPSAGPST